MRKLGFNSLFEMRLSEEVLPPRQKRVSILYLRCNIGTMVKVTIGESILFQFSI